MTRSERRPTRKPVAPRVARQVAAALAARYELRQWQGPTDPVDGLVATILSQNTTSRNSSAAFDSLISRFPTWDEVADAPEAAISRAIERGGLANQKAARIKRILRQLRNQYGHITLDFLDETPLREAFESLTAFKGVGPKTAACVLMFQLGRHVFPVDTHVFRVCKRLGWVPHNATPDAAQNLLQDELPGELMYLLHVGMVAHGRSVCRPTTPQCSQCPLPSQCDYHTGNS